MKINDSLNFQYFYSINNSKNKTQAIKDELNKARENDPVLDRALYISDIAEMYKKMAMEEAIAKKIAKGESLTPEEKEYAKEMDPKILRMAESVKEKSESLKDKLKGAKTKEEAQRVIMSASSEASMVIELGNSQYGELLMEGIRDAVSKYNKVDESFEYNKARNLQGKEKRYIDCEC